MSNTKTYLALVSEFHRVFKYRQPEPVAPDLSDKPTNELRPKLIAEELHEFKAAHDDNNRVEMLDALCDTQYVLSGAILAWGYRGMFENNSRIVINLSRIRDMNGHLAAMFGFNETMGIAAGLGFENQVYSMLEFLQRRLTQLVYHCKFQDVFYEAFCEVHRSNMSKQWSEHEVALHDSNSEPRLHFQVTDGCFYIAKRDDNKIIKSPGYSPADLSRFIK